MTLQYNDRKPMCLIPARGGSKRFPRKNLALLGGKPLIAWSVEPALKSGLFDVVWVSSEDPEILKVANEIGAAIINRPLDLSGDKVALEPVCRHAIDQCCDRNYSDLFVFLPTSPFRKSQSLKDAWKVFLESDSDTLMSVLKLSHPPQWSMRLGGDNRLEPVDQEGFDSERQNLEDFYRHDGAYFITKISSFFSTGRLMGENTQAMKSTRVESIDIDDPVDLAWAEFMLNHYQIGF